MRKHAETFHVNEVCKLAIVVFIPILSFSNYRNLWHTFQTLFAQKRGLAHAYFLYEYEALQHCLSNDNAFSP